MRETTPQVFLVSRPQLDLVEIESYLKEVDGLEWLDRVLPLKRRSDNSPTDGDLLVEFAGRLCYRSWKPGLNANVTKVREDSEEYLQNIMGQRHGAVVEHANYSFVFHNVSRVFTHELVRHRAGVAISQESLRYVRLTDLGFRIPEILKKEKFEEEVPEDELGRGRPESRWSLTPQIISLVETLEDFQRGAADFFGLDDEGVPFHYKKEVTSALRRLAPIGLSTGMIWTANVRTLRHVISMRTAEGAEEEIRFVFDQVAEKMKRECPMMFSDYSRQSNGEWITENWKV